ncbi:MAG: succinylglutamate desuccinylase/aspartoacylase family protein [Phycisphaerales bacterium]
MTQAARTGEAHTHRHHAREIGRYESMHTQATSSGATLVVIGGVHGNEPTGIFAAQRVLKLLNNEHPSAFNGRLIALRGNIAALTHRDPETRYIRHDLNRLFTDEQIALPASTSPEHEQMQELLATLRAIRAQSERMIVIDLHTTSADMPPVVVLEDSIPARRLARRMPLPIYLGFEEELPGLLMDRVTNELGAISLVVEGGQHKDDNAVNVHESVIWTMLDAAGILPIEALPHQRNPRHTLRAAVGDEQEQIYDIRYRYAISHPSFAIRDGIRSGQKIKRDVTIIATENDRAITSPTRGRVFMPNEQRHKRVGDDGFFVVRRVGEGWLGLSARLRRQRWLHGTIAYMPGVYPRDDGTLYVDADLAAVLRRQILHLLGYRLVRHDERSSGHGLFRVLNGIIAFTRAFLRGPIKGGPNPGDPRFWVVRRHKLDLD